MSSTDIVSKIGNFNFNLEGATGKKAVSVAAVLLFAVYLINRKAKNDRKRTELEKLSVKEVPELPGRKLIGGHFLHFYKYQPFVLDYLLKEATQIGRTFQFQLPLVPATVFTCDPMVIDRFFNTGFKEGIYEKSPQLLRQYSEFLGKGIFVSNGDRWKYQRKTARPLFDKKRLPTYVDLFVRNSFHLISTFKKIIQENSEEYQKNGIDFQDYFLRYTLDSFCEIGFGVNINSIEGTEDAVKFQKAFDYVQTFVEYRGRTGDLWRLKESIFPDSQFKQKLKLMDDFVYKIISQRKNETIESLSTKHDLLSQLLIQNLQNEDKSSHLTDSDLRDWVMNFLIAGRDTTAVTLTWCTFLLSKAENSEVVTKIIEEISALLEISVADFNAEKITPNFLSEKLNFQFQKNQKYLHNVIDETLRVYPPVPLDGYAATQDDVITTSNNERFLVRRGTFVVYSAWITHHHPSNYPNPEQFKPERWTTDQIVPSSFVPFHWGPRICLGQEMAYIETKVMLTCLLSQLKFKVVDESLVIPKRAIILTAAKGLPMFLSSR